MRIVHIGPANLPLLYRYGGAIERRIIELAKAQVALGHEVTVYSIGEKRGETQVDGVLIRHLPCKVIRKVRFIEFQVKAVRDLRSRNGPGPDVIHFHSQPEGAFMARRINVKKCLSYDNFDFRNESKTHMFRPYKAMLKQFGRLLPCSQYCLEESRKYWNLPEELLTPLYNGVNKEQFSPRPDLGMQERERLQLDQKVVLYVGRVCEQKGTHVLLDAFRILNAVRQDIKLVITGPISQFGNVEKNSPWLERIERVAGLYLGAVEEERLSSIYNLADIFVMPTIELEMFGMAAVEAQACGRPVIASDHGGLKETVPESCGGRFPIGDSGALAEQIMSLADDAGAYDAASKNALENAQKYTWEKIAQMSEKIYSGM